jgi:hypothetical protein
MKLPRRKFLHLAAGAATLPAVARFASAQVYPSRPVAPVEHTTEDRALGDARGDEPTLQSRDRAGNLPRNHIWRH